MNIDAKTSDWSLSVDLWRQKRKVRVLSTVTALRTTFPSEIQMVGWRSAGGLNVTVVVITGRYCEEFVVVDNVAGSVVDKADATRRVRMLSLSLVRSNFVRIVGFYRTVLSLSPSYTVL